MNKKETVKMPKRLTIYSFIPSIAFFLLAALSAINQSYNEMAIAFGVTLFGPGVWIYHRDLLNSNLNYELDEKKVQKILIFGSSFALAILAFMSGYEMFTGVLLLLAFGQFWFEDNIVAGKRVWHGLFATIIALWGLKNNVAIALVFLFLSMYFAYDYFKLQREESKKRNKTVKKSRKAKKKKK